MKKKRISLCIFIIGVVTLLGGVAFLLFKLLAPPAVRDAEFLVSVGKWQREDAEGVIWEFTEVGKGKLTTNNHANDYDFIWSIEGETLKIETNWLYTLNNEYTYELNQSEKTLTLTSDSTDINFRAVSSVDPEVPEDN